MSEGRIMKFTATEAKNKLGQVLQHAQRAPVFIEKGGRRHSVVVSAEHYDALLQAQAKERSADAGKAFYSRYKGWVDEQNRLVEAHGVFGEEWRAW